MQDSPGAEARAKKIKLIIFDVDGVLTDGVIWLIPAAPTNAGAQSRYEVYQQNSIGSAGQEVNGARWPETSAIETKGFHAHDGIGISLARLAGLKLGVITKRNSEVLAIRCRDLKLDHVVQGAHDKVAALQNILEQTGVAWDQTAYVGDDIVDLPPMRLCGLAIAVPNARDDVKREAHWVTPHRGGEGAGRDAIEYILRAQEKLVSIVEQYLQSAGAASMRGK